VCVCMCVKATFKGWMDIMKNAIDSSDVCIYCVLYCCIMSKIHCGYQVKVRMIYILTYLADGNTAYVSAAVTSDQ